MLSQLVSIVLLICDLCHRIGVKVLIVFVHSLCSLQNSCVIFLDEVHAYLRTQLASLYDEEVAQATRIQYGGSVTPESVDELMAQSDIDGCLVGGKI